MQAAAPKGKPTDSFEAHHAVYNIEHPGNMTPMHTTPACTILVQLYDSTSTLAEKGGAFGRESTHPDPGGRCVATHPPNAPAAWKALRALHVRRPQRPPTPPLR